MKNVFNMIKNEILICDLIFIGINILINFILYLINIRFRFWVIILIILISIIGFIIGIIQNIFKSSKYKKTIIITSVLCIVSMLILITIFMPFISFISIFSYHPEHTVSLDDKKYVAVVNSFPFVDVDYYNYYGPLLMGTKIKVHGYFGEGDFDPFKEPDTANFAEYTYYDKNGEAKFIRNETFIKDSNGKIIDKNVYEENVNSSDVNNKNNDYVLPEDEEVLYEKKFGKTILRFAKLDNGLGQNVMVNVIRSKDNGKNYYTMSDEPIVVSNEAKFVFLNENLGFAIPTGKIYLDNSKPGLYVTNDSGKTFSASNFKYENKNVEYISIEDVPYYDENTLKIKCSVYQHNSNKGEYESKELIFISNDSGVTWNLESN